MFGLDTLRNTKAGSKILRRGSNSSSSSSSSSSSERTKVDSSRRQQLKKRTSSSGKSGHHHHRAGNRKRLIGSFLTEWAQDEAFVHEYANNMMATPMYGTFGTLPY